MIENISKMIPESPDPIIASSPQSQAALPRFAHLNRVVEKVNEVVDQINTQLPENGTMQLPVLAADPITGLANGQIYYNSTLNLVRVRLAGVWTSL